MLKGLFPRLFGQFREGGIIHAKFIKSGGASPTYALKSAVGTQNYQALSLVANGGAGKCKLVLAGAARAMAMLGTPVHVNIGNPTDFTKQGIVSPGAAIVESTGTIVWTFYQSGIAGASGAAFDIADNDEVHVTLMVDR